MCALFIPSLYIQKLFDRHMPIRLYWLCWYLQCGGGWDGKSTYLLTAKGKQQEPRGLGAWDAKGGAEERGGGVLGSLCRCLYWVPTLRRATPLLLATPGVTGGCVCALGERPTHPLTHTHQRHTLNCLVWVSCKKRMRVVHKHFHAR